MQIFPVSVFLVLFGLEQLSKELTLLGRLFAICDPPFSKYNDGPVQKGRLWEFDRLAAEYSGNIQNLNSVLEFVPDGARILPMRGPGMRRDVRYAHVHAFAVPRAQAFIPTLFQGVHLLSLKKEWTNYAHSGAFLIDSRHTTKRVSFEDAPIRSDLHDFWANWQEKFTHVLSLDAAESDLPESPSLEQIAQSGRFTLFRVRSEN